jgi:cell division septation protein DedD
MTKSELILKFSKIHSVDQTDSKVFFEILLKKISNNLGVGQTISIPDFGCFHRIKGKIKKPSVGYSSDEISEEIIDLLLYSEEKKLGQSEAKGFVFNIPFIDDEDYHLVDSYFSLSIGKPLIPLRGTIHYDEYIPTSDYEYKKLLESKIENVLKDSVIDFSDEEFPTLVIDATAYTTSEIKLERVEEDLEEILSDTEQESPSTKESETVSGVKNIAWDFGEYFSGKISAESIIELTNEKIADSDSAIIKTENLQDSTAKEDTDIEEILDELLDRETESSSAEESVVNLDNLKTDPEKLLDELDEYEEVKFESSENYFDNDQSDEEFWKSASKLFETYDPREIRHEDGNIFTEVKSTSINLDEKTVADVKAKLTKDETEILDSEVVKKTEEIQQEEKSISSKKWVYAVLSLIIILASLGTYWYTQIYIKNKNLSINNDLKLNSNYANIINRDFSIPVSYPYDTKESVNDSIKAEAEIRQEPATQTETFVSENKTESQKSAVTQIKTEGLSEKNIPTERPVNMGNNIYRYGNIYFVQVASFKSNSIAENEAGKYRNKGYNSFVEQTEIPGRGIWYRIKVGNFSSLDEANNFIEKNIR